MTRSVAVLLAAMALAVDGAIASVDLDTGVDVSAALVRPLPKYPDKAKARGIQGSGIVLILVHRPTGEVKSVRIEKSTGYKILDEAALSAFRRWRFKPGAVSRVHMPVTFTKHDTTRK